MSAHNKDLEEGMHFEKFKHVEAHIHVGEARVEGLEVNVVHIFCDEAWDLRCWVTDDVEQGHNVGSACKILKDLDFALDFLLLHRLQDLDDAFLLCYDVDSLEDLDQGQN